MGTVKCSDGYMQRLHTRSGGTRAECKPLDFSTIMHLENNPTSGFAIFLTLPHSRSARRAAKTEDGTGVGMTHEMDYGEYGFIAVVAGSHT